MKKEIIIGENDGGQRLDRFLSKTFPALKSSIINKAVRNKDIRLKGKRTEANVRLEKGDRVYVYFPDRLLENKPVNDDFTAAGDYLSVVYEDENILFVQERRFFIIRGSIFPKMNSHLRPLYATG